MLVLGLLQKAFAILHPYPHAQVKICMKAILPLGVTTMEKVNREEQSNSGLLEGLVYNQTASLSFCVFQSPYLYLTLGAFAYFISMRYFFFQMSLSETTWGGYIVTVTLGL